MRKIKQSFLAALVAALILPAFAVAGKLTVADKYYLSFMRSEEKLARDVYLTLAEIYPQAPVFYQIATKAEQVHTDRVKLLLTSRGLPDPEPDADKEDYYGTGEFQNPDFADYFHDKYKSLIDGAYNLLQALHVGAYIEELDMLDINICNGVVLEMPGVENDECKLENIEVNAIKKTMQNLLEGSENHLCAFISQIGIIDDECYDDHFVVDGQCTVHDIVEERCDAFLTYVCEDGCSSN